MKKTKLYAKKTFSVFMAIMMLMTAWVFVAPEKASAVSVDKPSVPSYASYHVEVKITDTGSGHIILRYHPVNSDGSVNTSVTDEYVLVNSFGAYTNGTYTFKTSDDSTRKLSSDTSAETGPVNGWICGVRWVGKLHYIKIGNVTVLSEGTWTASSERSLVYNDSAWGNSYITNWKKPELTSVRSAPAAKTIKIPKSGDASDTFTATFNDQFGAQWPSTSGLTASLSNNLGGNARVSLSGNTATVTGDLKVFGQSDYNSSNGQIKTTLNMTQGGKTASCDVTFQAPKYNVYLKDIKGNTVKTYSNAGYYKQNIKLTDVPANTKAAQIPNDATNHTAYQWPSVVGSTFTLNDDTTYTETAYVTTHNYGAWTNAGDNHTKTCADCGYVMTAAHTKGTVASQKAETCTENGNIVYNCADCGKASAVTEVVDKIGHDFSGEIVENVTGENGNHWQKCERCGVYGWGTTAEACQNHIWDKNNDGNVNIYDVVDSKTSTCTEEGYEKYTCKACNAEWTKKLALKDHAIKHVEAKDVTNTCSGKGNAEYWTCTECKNVWKDVALTDELSDKTDADGNNIPDALETNAGGHEFTGAYVSAMDGADGEHYRQCARFDTCRTYGLAVDGVQTAGAKAKHDFDSETKESTCTEAGYTKYTCKDCGSNYKVDLELARHIMTKTEGKPATCTESGTIEYYTCSVCNKKYDDANGTNEVQIITVNALQHTFIAGGDDSDPENDRCLSPATCQAAAIYAVTCDRCGTEGIDATYSYGNPDTENGHKFDGAIQENADGTHSYKCTVAGCKEYGAATSCNFSKVKEDVPSTCRAIGYIIYGCADCKNEKRVDKTAYDFTNHAGGTEIRFAKPATCYADGFTGDTHCLGCGVKLEAGEKIVADPKVHPHENMVNYDKVPATCQTEGHEAYSQCTACKEYGTAKVTIDKKDHKFTTYVTNGDGTHTAICDTCDDVAPKATKDGDCTGGKANCQDKAVCDTCKSPYGEIDAENHKTVVTEKKKDSTCQTEGYEPYKKCSACGVNVGTPVVIAKKEHSYGAWTKLEDADQHTRFCITCDADVDTVAAQTADCNGGTANCKELAKCADCKSLYGDVDPENHKTTANTLKDVVAATCQNEGFSGNYYYDCCGAIKTAGETTAKLDHKFDIVIEEVAATCIAKGEITYKCSTCVETDDVKAETYKKEFAVDAKNHASDETVVKNKKDATCEENGNTGDIYYACCYVEGADEATNKKALKEKGTTIKADGQHVYGDAVPNYMIERIDEAEDKKTIVLKTAEPDYDAKIEARQPDGKWYHTQLCTICYAVKESACYTYEHTYDCESTDICEVCAGLCSLIDENKHVNLVEIEAVEVTHNTDGAKAYYMCECGKFFLDDAGKNEFDPESEDGKKLITISKETVPCEKGEELVDEYVAPTCVEDGYKVYKCANEECTKKVKEIIPAGNIGHEWSTEYRVIKDPTCGRVGYKALYCTVCDTVKPNSTETVPAEGEHTNELISEIEGSSCVAPTVKNYKCSVCGAESTETIYDGKTDHEWGDPRQVGGDCSTGVMIEYKCTVAGCGATKRETDTSSTHQYETIIRVEPTPEADGYEMSKCKNCGAEKTETVKYEGYEADEHVYDESKYTVVIKQSCDTPEIREYTCVRCGEKVQAAYGKASEHVWIKQAEEKATCDTRGHSEYYRCVRCLEEYGRVNYAPLGHSDEKDNNGRCDRCNYVFYQDGEGADICSCICHEDSFFMNIIYRIISFFWKLFKIEKTCECGVGHY